MVEGFGNGWRIVFMLGCNIVLFDCVFFARRHEARCFVALWYSWFYIQPFKQMKSPKIRWMPSLLASLFLTMLCQAQRSGFDPAQIRERMLGRYQEALEVSGEEWTILKPMIAAILEKQFADRGSRFGRRGNRDREGNQRNRTSRTRGGDGTRNDLSDAISSDDETKIKAALARHRADRKKRAAELAKARFELQQLLTLKQEARLVMMGLLE